MATFDDLPPELLLQILSQLEPTPDRQLCSACLVQSNWTPHARALLYAHISIRVSDEGSAAKAGKLFETLSNSPHLGRIVQFLGIYGWFRAGSLYHGPWTLGRALSYCTNLRRLSWFTQAYSYSEALGSLPDETTLAELSFDCSAELSSKNHSALAHNLDSDDCFIKLSSLSRLTIKNPSPEILFQLAKKPSFKRIGSSLKGLTFSLDSGLYTGPHITDNFIRSIATYMPSLEAFEFTYCRAVTHEAPLAILAATSNAGSSVKAMTLTYLSVGFDIAIFAAKCSSAGYLRQLTSITIEVRHDQEDRNAPQAGWIECMMQLVWDCPLNEVRLESFDCFYSPPGLDVVCTRLVDRHGERLQTLELIDAYVSTDVLVDIFSRCPGLKYFYGGVFEKFEERKRLAFLPQP